MAINEACQVWIEQRISEELSTKGDKSLREIGRELAAEIEKVFETKVHPRTLEKRAGRMCATNVALTATLQNNEEIAGDTGDKMPKPAEVFKEYLQLIETKKISTREADEIVGEKYGKNPGAIRKMCARERCKETEPGATQAVTYAGAAISKLMKIRDDDERLQEALIKVINYCNTRVKR